MPDKENVVSPVPVPVVAIHTAAGAAVVDPAAGPATVHVAVAPAPADPAAVNSLAEAINRLTKIIEDQTYTPWASKISIEYATKQDLDGDSQVFGHEICIAELDLYPPVLRGLVHGLREKIENHEIIAIPAASYVTFLKDKRDEVAVRKIFGLAQPNSLADNIMKSMQAPAVEGK